MSDSLRTHARLTEEGSPNSLPTHPRKGTGNREVEEESWSPIHEPHRSARDAEPVDNSPAAVVPVMDGIDEDQPLFGGYEPPRSETVEQLSAGQRLTRRQAQQIAAGAHPLGGTLHPDADRNRTADSAQDGTPTCGTCLHRQALGYHGKSYPKCLRNPKTVTHGTATDVRAWWPACRDYQPKEA